MARSWVVKPWLAPAVLVVTAALVSFSGSACLGTAVNLGALPDVRTSIVEGGEPECRTTAECKDKVFLSRCISGACVAYMDDEVGCTRPIGDAADEGDTIVLGTFFSQKANFESARTALLEETAIQTLGKWNDAAGTARVRKAAAIACDESSPDLGKALSHMRALGVNVVVGPSSPILARTVAMLAVDRKLSVIAPFQEEGVPPKALFQGRHSRVDLHAAAVAAVRDVVAVYGKVSGRSQRVFIVSADGDADKELHARLVAGLSSLTPEVVKLVHAEDEDLPDAAFSSTTAWLPEVVVLNTTQSAASIIHRIESRSPTIAAGWKPTYVIFGGDPMGVSTAMEEKIDGRAFWGQFSDSSEFDTGVSAIRNSLLSSPLVQDGGFSSSSEFRWYASDAFYTALYASQIATGVKPASEVFAVGLKGLAGFGGTEPALIFYSADRLSDGFAQLAKSPFLPVFALGATGLIRWGVQDGRRLTAPYMALRCRRDSAWHGSSRKYRTSDGARFGWVLPPTLPLDALCPPNEP
ncbi:MAG: hypothetical protein U0174_21825 [Polyangiaceae bacterium]